MVHIMCPLERESFKLAACVSILVIDDVIFVRVTCAMDCLFRAMESMDVLVQEVSKRRGTAEVDNELKDLHRQLTSSEFTTYTLFLFRFL